MGFCTHAWLQYKSVQPGLHSFPFSGALSPVRSLCSVASDTTVLYSYSVVCILLDFGLI